ncbi:MAG: prolyl oligopeptidase family serine peptidase [Verrucomicrobiota bacterium]
MMNLGELDAKPLKRAYPEEVKTVEYLSMGDESLQPALFWKPEGKTGKVPLLVALHTWSNDYTQAGGEVLYAEWCQQVDWAFIHPNFRGPNWTPAAMGSELAVADILSAVEFAKQEASIDEDRIYVIGVSGGGHASLLMAGRAPRLWAGVSAWCGISDIAAWHRECSENEQFIRYANHIEKALGGAPFDDPDRLKDAQQRSPITWLNSAGDVPLDINHGVHDGRTGSVPFSHSLHAWNAAVPEVDRFDSASIGQVYESQNFETPFDGVDALYGARQPVFRKTSGATRLTIFEGDHEIIHEAALNWLAAQHRGKEVVWEVEKVADLKSDEADKESGK